MVPLFGTRKGVVLFLLVSIIFLGCSLESVPSRSETKIGRTRFGVHVTKNGDFVPVDCRKEGSKLRAAFCKCGGRSSLPTDITLNEMHVALEKMWIPLRKLFLYSVPGFLRIATVKREIEQMLPPVLATLKKKPEKTCARIAGFRRDDASVFALTHRRHIGNALFDISSRMQELSYVDDYLGASQTWKTQKLWGMVDSAKDRSIGAFAAMQFSPDYLPFDELGLLLSAEPGAGKALSLCMLRRYRETEEALGRRFCGFAWQGVEMREPVSNKPFDSIAYWDRIAHEILLRANTNSSGTPYFQHTQRFFQGKGYIPFPFLSEKPDEIIPYSVKGHVFYRPAVTGCAADEAQRALDQLDRTRVEAGTKAIEGVNKNRDAMGRPPVDT